jgi:hypothetical protein
MRRGLSALMMFLCFSATDALALSIGYGGSSLPFSVNYHPDVQPSIEAIIEVVNNSSAAAVALAWQLQLEIRSVEGAHGQLLFQSTSTPPNSLFGQMPGPMSDLTSPSSTVLASDSDSTNFSGVEISSHSARNILQLTLQASPDAAGAFQLITPEFDAANPNSASSWFPADGTDPVAFDNAAPSAFSGFVLLGIVNVSSTYRSGDYDRDGVVGPLDYDLWRAHFGNSVSTPGTDADGNQNSIVDAADYVIWRSNLPAAQPTSGSEAFGKAAPEPGTMTFALVTLALMACRRYYGR